MMFTHPRPIVVVSKCLGFARCRWNGVEIEDKGVDLLRHFVDFRPVCPEMAVGFGCPRDPIRVVRENKTDHLMQPATGRDITEEMTAFADDFLGSLDKVDGFFLKYKSPSCGIANVKQYSAIDAKGPNGVTTGFFGRAVKARFPDLPVEDEGRMHNFGIREHWLIRIFTLARLREAQARGKMKDLVQFHAEHKLLLMAFHQSKMRTLGKLVANAEKRPPAELFAEYRTLLGEALQKSPRPSNAVNVLMHGLGYFKESLTAKEKAYFLDTLDNYRERHLPLSVPSGILKGWIVRYENAYLAQQIFFEPYPQALISVTDSGKGRDL